MAAAAIGSLPLAVVHLHESGIPLTPSKLFVVAGPLLFAAVPIMAVTLALSWAELLAAGTGFIAAGAVITVALSIAGRLVAGEWPTADLLLNAFFFVQFLAWMGVVPWVLMFATGARRIRGVAPIVYAGILMFGLAPVLGSRAASWLASSSSGTRLLLQFGLDAAFIVLAFPAAWLALKRLQMISRWHQQKRSSDAMLLSRVWWLMGCAWYTVTIVNSSGHWWLPFAGGLGSYLLFLLVQRVLMTWILAREQRPPPRRLLLLRIFGQTARTESLFDSVGTKWLLYGPILTVAAPDIAARSLNPDSFLRLVSGQIVESFVVSRGGLQRRLDTLDEKPDPDGRYRISDFCCRDNTWRATVVELMDRADVVLMDLRGLNSERHGCEFELQQLAQRVSPSQVVLLIDDETDCGLITQAFAHVQPPRIAWGRRWTWASTGGVMEALLAAA
jgi:hypothetical protein